MTVPRPRPRQPRQLDAGPLEPLIGSFRLHLAAEGKAARTVQGYTSAVRWFAVGYLLGQADKASWEQVDAQDIQRWMRQLLDRYSGAYASIQFRALRQFLCGQSSFPGHGGCGQISHYGPVWPPLVPDPRGGFWAAVLPPHVHLPHDCEHLSRLGVQGPAAMR